MTNLFKHINCAIDTRLPEGDMSGIRLRDIRWDVKTAGPSPDDNQRVELFLLGCKRAMQGEPCKGCFNSSTWNNNASWTHDPVLMAQHINQLAPNKYITIGGGEPLDQIENLIILCKELKKYGFHIIVYTWRPYEVFFQGMKIYNLGRPAFAVENNMSQELYDLAKEPGRINARELFDTIDILIDGEYKEEEKLWDGTKADGLLSSVGSGNQGFVVKNKDKNDITIYIRTLMRDIEKVELDSNNKLTITKKES